MCMHVWSVLGHTELAISGLLPPTCWRQFSLLCLDSDLEPHVHTCPCQLVHAGPSPLLIEATWVLVRSSYDQVSGLRIQHNIIFYIRHELLTHLIFRARKTFLLSKVSDTIIKNLHMAGLASVQTLTSLDMIV